MIGVLGVEQGQNKDNGGLLNRLQEKRVLQHCSRAILLLITCPVAVKLLVVL